MLAFACSGVWVSPRGKIRRLALARAPGRLYSAVPVTILSPSDSLTLVPELASSPSPNVWVYRFVHPEYGWTLSVATHAEPGSGKLSLGGFRIAPVERTSTPGFTADREAIALAMGMEEKVRWSRVTGIGGPLAMRDITRIVGGKCVLAPSEDARIGQPHDTELLDFALAAFREIEATAGIHLTTGQDLGHGTLHDGSTTSLAYLNKRFKGSVVADTSVPTAEGNYQLLRGMLRACGIPMGRALVGLIGCGNIGMHIVRRMRDDAPGVTILVCESRGERRKELEAMGIRTWAAGAKREFIAQPMDALVVNAAGGTLDHATVLGCAANGALRVICGSENLAMPDPADEQLLREAKKLYAPAELGGMMGYLTAVEEYLSALEGVPFVPTSMLAAAAPLEGVGFEASTRIIKGGYRETFEVVVGN
jgi:hypothetical protein